MTTRRERVRQAAIAEIKATAWDIIHEQGSADVSVHGIARRMGMTAPAFYSYFRSRDELMVSLVLDAYDSYRQALEFARDAFPEQEAANRIMAVYLSYREWSVGNPVSFGLFAGSEVPGFNPPERRIVQRAEAVTQIFISEYREAWQKKLLKIPKEACSLPSSYRLQIEAFKETMGLPVPEEIVNAIIHIALLAHGTISMEISGRFHHFTDDFSQLYAYQISNQLQRIGLVSDPLLAIRRKCRKQ